MDSATWIEYRNFFRRADLKKLEEMADVCYNLSKELELVQDAEDEDDLSNVDLIEIISLGNEVIYYIQDVAKQRVVTSEASNMDEFNEHMKSVHDEFKRISNDINNAANTGVHKLQSLLAPMINLLTMIDQVFKESIRSYREDLKKEMAVNISRTITRLGKEENILEAFEFEEISKRNMDKKLLSMAAQPRKRWGDHKVFFDELEFNEMREISVKCKMVARYLESILRTMDSGVAPASNTIEHVSTNTQDLLVEVLEFVDEQDAVQHGMEDEDVSEQETLPFMVGLKEMADESQKLLNKVGLHMLEDDPYQDYRFVGALLYGIDISIQDCMEDDQEIRKTVERHLIDRMVMFPELKDEDSMEQVIREDQAEA